MLLDSTTILPKRGMCCRGNVNLRYSLWRLKDERSGKAKRAMGYLEKLPRARYCY